MRRCFANKSSKTALSCCEPMRKGMKFLTERLSYAINSFNGNVHYKVIKKTIWSLALIGNDIYKSHFHCIEINYLLYLFISRWYHPQEHRALSNIKHSSVCESSEHNYSAFIKPVSLLLVEHGFFWLSHCLYQCSCLSFWSPDTHKQAQTHTPASHLAVFHSVLIMQRQ